MVSNRKAFTLVELSIVLVIIGLLVGGIIAGQSMLDAQKVRNILQDARTYATAMQQFKDKYGSLPGDMPDAERIWGTTSNGCPNGASNDGITTCNGNGDGIIDQGPVEGFRAWQQMGAAGMIIGKYTGISGSGNVDQTIPGVNAPKGSVRNSTFFIYDWGVQPGDGNYFPGSYRGAMEVGIQAGDWPNTPVLTTRDALAMDQKVDDGRPGTGDIRSFATGLNPGCATTNDPTTAYYNLSTTVNGPTCNLVFPPTFEAKPKS